MLTDDMRRIIAAWPLGFVASLNADGTPNLSPKGTFVVLGEDRLAFGHIRSPRTIGNLRRNPVLEVCFLDVLSRKAVKVRGEARVIERGAPEAGSLEAAFAAWGEYAPLIKAYVEVAVRSAALILSPAYDLGHGEDDLKRDYKAKFAAL